jgi:protein TonB
MGSLVSQPERAKPVRSRVHPRTVRWSFGLSFALHAAVLLSLLLLARHALAPEGEVASVELVMVPASPEQAPAAALVARSDESATSAEPETVPQHQPTPDEPPVPEQQTVPVQQAASEPPAPEPPAPAQEAVPQAAPVIAEPPPPPPPPPLQPVRVPRPPHREPAQSNSPMRTAASRTQTATARSLSESPAAAPAAPAAPTAPVQQGTPEGADPSWLARVGAWLLAHRSYPEMDRALGRQGTVVVRITVSPDGLVEDVNVVRGSGTDSLDRAAEALVRGAHLPPFPPDMKLPRQSVTVPIHYRLE